MNQPHIMPFEANELIDRCKSGDHICMFYSSKEERDMIVSYFIMIGLEGGERVLYIDRDEDPSAIILALQKLSIDTDSAMASGQLSIADSNSTYLPSGHFDAGKMTDLLKNYSATTPKERFSGLRIIGDAPCDGGCQTSIDNFVEYERGLGYFFPGSNVSALCLYDLSLFPEGLPHPQILSAHPLILRNNEIVDNPDYQLPFKKETVG